MPTVTIDRLLDTAYHTGASDLLLTVGTRPRLRIAGCERSLETAPLALDDIEAALHKLLRGALRSEYEEHRRVLFGFVFRDWLRIRAFAAFESGHPTLSMRCLPAKPPTIDELDLPKLTKALMSRPCGLFVIAGPAGCGKTTVQAALVNYVNRNFDRRIVTIQQPVEHLHQSVKSALVQREVGTDVDSYLQAVRDLHLQRADVVALGDVDDDEALAVATEAARTDCLMLMQMRERGAADVLAHLCEIGGQRSTARWRHIVSTTFLGTIVRRLIPRKDASVVPAHEFLVVTPAVSELIRDNQLHRIDSAIQAGRKFDMRLLDDHLFELAAAGTITVENALENARCPSDLQRRLDKHRRGDAGDDADPSDDTDPTPFPVRPDQSPPNLDAHAAPDTDESPPNHA
ncbi:MAG: Flp pilus assembly complex ATPase component TadA [Phycisphaerae bacterium]|nr:Flp pilus assembly complex ATPase component TadA [Phycisphaerae bacterium]